MKAPDLLDPDDYEAARQARDPRFDGRFFVGVLTTGIYCRPVCPVRIPKKENVQLYQSAAAAAAAGFRPCLRCRPESSPGTPAWSGSSWKVSRALQLIDQGYLDSASVEELAEQLEIGPRQLSRLFNAHLGASPVEVAQTRRLHFAKKLIDETDMPLSDICFAAGFGSVRRFNAVFNAVYKRSPIELRNKRRTLRQTHNDIELSLSFRPPFDWRNLLAFLAYRAIPGVEQVTDQSYARTFLLDGIPGHTVAVFNEQSNTIQLRVSYPKTRHLYQIIERMRSVFDLRADSAQIDAWLARDRLLKPMVARFPGSRVPGCWSGFEVAVRAILGQQVTVKAASTLVARIAQRYGNPYACDIEGLEYTFPEPSVLAAADLSGMGIVGQRIDAIKQVATMVADGELSIDCTIDTDTFVKKICAVKGIGEWTAQYIAMRALNDPNAFPHSDLILLRSAARHKPIKAGQVHSTEIKNGAVKGRAVKGRAINSGQVKENASLSPKQLLKLAEPWQPWRAYAVILLWRNHAAHKNQSNETGKNAVNQAVRKNQSNKAGKNSVPVKQKSKPKSKPERN